MKTKFLFAIVTLVFIAGCKKEKFLKQIDGNWKINKIVYSGGTLSSDSVVINPGTALYFIKCSVKESRIINNCAGKYGVAGDGAEFIYSFQEDYDAGLNLSIYLAPLSPEIDNQYNSIIKHIVGQYAIIELTSSTLKIKSTCCVNWSAGATIYNTRYLEASK